MSDYRVTFTDEEIDLYQLRVAIRGAVDIYARDSGKIVGILLDLDQIALIRTMNSIEAILRWLMGVVEAAVAQQEK